MSKEDPCGEDGAQSRSAEISFARHCESRAQASESVHEAERPRGRARPKQKKNFGASLIMSGRPCAGGHQSRYCRLIRSEQAQRSLRVAVSHRAPPKLAASCFLWPLLSLHVAPRDLSTHIMHLIVGQRYVILQDGVLSAQFDLLRHSPDLSSDQLFQIANRVVWAALHPHYSRARQGEV